MNATRPRAIFDCNVLFQAFLTRRGPSSECIRLVEVGRVRLVTSLDVLSEARDVLSHPFVLERAPHVTPASIDSFLKDLAYRANLWRTVPHYVDGFTLPARALSNVLDKRRTCFECHVRAPRCALW